MQLDEPNITFPLVPSYNERGINGYTATVTNSLDQRKVNCWYELVDNAMSGKRTAYLVKRQGAEILGSSFGLSGDTPYLIKTIDPTSHGTSWLFAKNGNITKVSNSSTSTTILNSASFAPAYVDQTYISGTRTIVAQLRDPNGGTSQRVYYASDIASWTEITDADFTALALCGKIEHMGGFAFVLTSLNRIHGSDINSLANWTATNYDTKQITQDDPAGLAKLGEKIVVFGENSVEVWYNAGNQTGLVLSPIPQLSAKFGLGMAGGTRTGQGRRHYTAEIGGVLYFVGKEIGNSFYSNSLCAFNGSRFERVSPPHIDKILAGSFVRSVCAVGIEGRSAIAIQLTDTTDATQRWLMYVPEWKDWFEWTSTVFQPVCDVGGHFIGISGAASANRVYWLSSTDIWQDDGTNYDRIVQLKMPSSKGSARKFMRWLGLEGTMERTACIETVQVSDDDGQNWTTLGTIDRTAQKQAIYRGGSYRTRHIRFTNSTGHQGRIENMLARVD